MIRVSKLTGIVLGWTLSSRRSTSLHQLWRQPRLESLTDAPFQFRLSPRRFKASSTLTGPLCILPRKLGWWSRRRKTMSWINWINPSGSWWQLSRRQSRRWHSIHGWCHRGCWGLCGSWNCWSHWDSLMSLVVLPWLHLKMPLHEQLASYLHEQLTSQLQA